MNLLWDLEAPLRSMYLYFLRNICKAKNKPITINQENIYKLYKIFSGKKSMISINDYFNNGLFNQYLEGEHKKFAQELMNFFADLSFGRNHVWKNYLLSYFKEPENIS